jgi:hypothetical protein
MPNFPGNSPKPNASFPYRPEPGWMTTWPLLSRSLPEAIPVFEGAVKWCGNRIGRAPCCGTER